MTSLPVMTGPQITQFTPLYIRFGGNAGVLVQAATEAKNSYGV